MRYHVGLTQHEGKAVIQMYENKDCLDCELIEYFGEHDTTPDVFDADPDQLLFDLNTLYSKSWTSLEVWVD